MFQHPLNPIVVVPHEMYPNKVLHGEAYQREYLAIYSYLHHFNKSHSLVKHIDHQHHYNLFKKGEIHELAIRAIHSFTKEIPSSKEWIQRHQQHEIMYLDDYDIRCTHCGCILTCSIKDHEIFVSDKMRDDIYDSSYICPANHLNPYEISISIPSGSMLFANEFFDIFGKYNTMFDHWTPPDTKYPYHSIDYLYSRIVLTERYARLGCAHIFMDDGACNIFQTSPNKDAFTVASWPSLTEGVEEDEYIARIDTSRNIYGAVDYEIAKSRGFTSSDEAVVIDCEPGTYLFQNLMLPAHRLWDSGCISCMGQRPLHQLGNRQ